MRRIFIVIITFILILSELLIPNIHTEKVEASTWIDISTPADLINIRNNLSGNYRLVNDIDLSQHSSNWTPIGNSSNPFTGVLDGQGHVIKNFQPNRVNQDNFGLFGVVERGVIKNLGLENVNISGVTPGIRYTGALAGYFGETGKGGQIIENVYVTGHVRGFQSVGALVGRLDFAEIKNSYSNASVTANNEVGGLAGHSAYGVITTSYATGRVNGAWSGGLIGRAVGSVRYTNSFWDKDTTGQETTSPNYSNPNATPITEGAKSTSQMKQKSTFTNWDFDNIWRIDEGKDYPRLKILDYNWNENSDGTIRITDYVGPGGDIIIPSTIDGKKVTSLRGDGTIDGRASFQDKNLTSVVIPEGITGLEHSLFQNNKIKHVSFPSTLTAIEYTVFRYNELTKVDLPPNVRSVAFGSFRNNNITEVIVRGKDTSLHYNGGNEHPFPFNQENPSKLTIIGHSGSSAESLAKNVGFTFVRGNEEVTFSSNGNSTWAKSHSTRINVDGYDSNKSLQYAWSTSTSTPSSGWSTLTNGASITRSSGTGNYYLHVRGTNNFGEAFNVRSNAFRVDNTLPSISISKNGGDWARNHFTTLSVSDSHSGIDKIEYRWTTSSSFPSSGFTGVSNGTELNTPTSTGNHYLHIRATDKAGNVRQFTSNVFRVDRIAPTLNLSPSTTNYTNGNVTITATSSDNHSGVRRIRLSGGSWVNNSSMNHTVSSNGTYTFEVEDNAGNTRTQSITINNIDKTLPTVSLSKNGGSWARSHSTTINASDSDSGINTIQYLWTTSSNFPSSGTFTTISNGSSVSAPNSTGNHYLHVRVTDNAGNTRNFSSNVFRIDRTAPTSPKISASSDWVNINQSITITSGSDNHSGVDRTEYRLNNGSWVTYNNPISITSNGETNIQARTIDNVGNISQIVNATVKIDKVNPTLTITPNTTSTTHEDVILTITATDTHSGINAIELPNGEKIYESKVTYNVKENGRYTFRAYDNAGNVTTQSYDVTNIDKTSSFDGPSISSFGTITLSEEPTVITTNITPITIRDWREGSNEWRLDVSANQMKLVGDSFYLPKGTMRLKSVSSINRVSGSGSLPTKTFSTTQVIDDGRITVVVSENSRGEYNIVFPNNALELIIDPTIAKAGKYESTIRWEFVNAP